jgi:hypothetical protein
VAFRSRAAPAWRRSWAKGVSLKVGRRVRRWGCTEKNRSKSFAGIVAPTPSAVIVAVCPSATVLPVALRRHALAARFGESAQRLVEFGVLLDLPGLQGPQRKRRDIGMDP